MIGFAPNKSLVDRAASLGESRARVLAVLQDDGGVLTAEEVGRRVGLHPNTCRFHLDRLVEAGLVGREIEERDRPGRPHTLYTACRDSQRAGQRSYRLLAEILTGCLAAELEQPAKAARRAGRMWGRYFAEPLPPSRRIGANEARRQVSRMLDQLGFAPELSISGTKEQILLRHCPFREIAEGRQDIVCAIHLGLMQGLLRELDAPVEAENLTPFVEPSLCVARLGSRRRHQARTATAE